MPKGQPFSVAQKQQAILRVQELLKTGACSSPWAAVVKVSQELHCSPETVRVWLTKQATPPKRRGRPPKNAAVPVLAERVAERVKRVAGAPAAPSTSAAAAPSSAMLLKKVSQLSSQLLQMAAELQAIQTVLWPV